MKLLREPLLHFAVAGAVMFGAYAWLNRNEPPASAVDRTIRITERELTWLADTSARTWQRTPNGSEFEALIADYLREELLAREARELELDRDDRAGKFGAELAGDPLLIRVGKHPRQ